MGKKRTRSSFPLRAMPGGHISSQGPTNGSGVFSASLDVYRIASLFLPHPRPAKVIGSLFCFNGISQLTREAEDLPLTKYNLSALRLQELTFKQSCLHWPRSQPLQALTIPRK